MRGIGRVSLMLVVVACTACNGFPDAPPWAEAERKPEKYPSYTATPAPMLSTEGQRWVIQQGSVFRPVGNTLQSVATGMGGELSVARWDRPPYDALYARSQDGLLRVAGEVR